MASGLREEEEKVMEDEDSWRKRKKQGQDYLPAKYGRRDFF